MKARVARGVENGRGHVQSRQKAFEDPFQIEKVRRRAVGRAPIPALARPGEDHRQLDRFGGQRFALGQVDRSQFEERQAVGAGRVPRGRFHHRCEHRAAHHPPFRYDRIGQADVLRGRNLDPRRIDRRFLFRRGQMIGKHLLQPEVDEQIPRGFLLLEGWVAALLGKQIGDLNFRDARVSVDARDLLDQIRLADHARADIEAVIGRDHLQGEVVVGNFRGSPAPGGDLLHAAAELQALRGFGRPCAAGMVTPSSRRTSCMGRSTRTTGALRG